MKRIIFILIAGIVICTHPMNAQNQKLKITIGSNEFTATLNDNETVRAFVDILPLTVHMNEMGGYEKYHYLPQNLPGSATNPGTTYEGDLMIWASNCLVLFYTTRSTSYSYIRLGRIDDTSGLRQALGTGNVEITFELEGNSTDLESIEEMKNISIVSALPAENYVEVTGDFETLSLYSLSGKLVAQSRDKIIRTDNLPPGVYLLRIESRKEGSVTLKISKF
ncbi:MAG: T9SS type A sorting domain-containing protein [Bacteroidales bacterium]|nr:T9SS type A sorting domain-containing protein [Bacteroidales bacterium]